MAIRSVRSYQTSDGELHTTKLLAKRHEAELELVSWVDGVVQDIGLDPTGFSDAVAHQMRADADHLIALLRTFVDRRPKAFMVEARPAEPKQEVA